MRVFIIEETKRRISLRIFKLKQFGLLFAAMAFLSTGALSFYQGLNSAPKDVLWRFQQQQIDVPPEMDSFFAIDNFYQFHIKQAELAKFSLSVAEYRNEAGEKKRAIVFPPEKSTVVLSINDLRERVWRQAAEAIKRNIAENALLFSWWDSGQRLHLLTGRELWVKAPLSDLYPEQSERELWGSVAGGYDSDMTRLTKLSEWLLMDAEKAIQQIRQQIPQKQNAYLVVSVDDLARIEEISRLSGKALAIESKVFYRSDNIHATISAVKQWVREKGTGRYLVHPVPGIGIRAWRILNEADENLLLLRLLPFTHALEQPLQQLKQVFQSKWGGYLSIYQL